MFLFFPSFGGSVVLPRENHPPYQEMDRARRAHAEKLERDQAERAKERQEAEAKSRSREALFNTPFAGVLGGMGGWDEWWLGWMMGVVMCQDFEVVKEGYFVFGSKNMTWVCLKKRWFQRWKQLDLRERPSFEIRENLELQRWISDSVPLVLEELGQLTPLPFYNTTPEVKQKEKRWKMGIFVPFWRFDICTFWIVFGSLYLFENGIFVPFPFSASECTFHGIRSWQGWVISELKFGILALLEDDVSR